jgi:hypothetical protein
MWQFGDWLTGKRDEGQGSRGAGSIGQNVIWEQARLTALIGCSALTAES